MTVPPIFTTFRFWKAVTFQDSVIVNNPDGTPVNLAGWDAVLVIRRNDDYYNALPPLFTLSTAPGAGIETLDVTGRVAFSIPAPQVGVLIDTNVVVDPDGEMWPFTLTLTNTAATPDYAERLVQGYIIAQP